MIFSRWKPSGGYDYFEAGLAAPLGDDLPIPSIHEIGGIGAPSTELGRALPARAHHVGSGAPAVGMVVPMSRAAKIHLEGDADESVIPPYLRWMGVGAAVVGGLWLLSSWRRS